jgi:hypothetical protein
MPIHIYSRIYLHIYMYVYIENIPIDQLWYDKMQSFGAIVWLHLHM